MKKLWDKGIKLNEFVESFETKDDLVLDQELVLYDVYGTMAHVAVLAKIKILTPKEHKTAQKGLQEIMEMFAKGEFIPQMGDEDVHTKIENYLTTKYGEVGKKIHTGRSRNDQVLTMLRLFIKDQSLSLKEELLLLIEAFIQFAKQHGSIPMPGYTHMQKAMPSSIGLWAESFIESLLDDYFLFQQSLKYIDQSPLGSGAGYGVSLPLDRAYTASLLGFEKVQNNPLYCQNSRSKFDAAIIASLLQIGLTINKCASDVMQFSTSEYNFFAVSDSLLSGSSIMPQKKNVDIAELLRSKVHLLLGFYTQIISLSTNLPSGYNRDIQDAKEALLKSFSITISSLHATKIVAENLVTNKTKLESAMTSELYATDAAFALVQKGIPFRTAYQHVAKDLSSLGKKSLQKQPKASSVLRYEKQVKKMRDEFRKEKKRKQDLLEFLLKGGE
ncbi:MAG: argininosuccinate lyase [Candidatus Levybacteria bacterium]|nr:argininosuccinate lyase [Candidatus Levybacteria bacterium]